MKNMGLFCQAWIIFRTWIILTLFIGKCYFCREFSSNDSASRVNLLLQPNNVIMSNGIVELTLSSPGGFVTGIRYNGIENVLSTSEEQTKRGYFDTYIPGSEGRRNQDRLSGTEVNVIIQTKDQVEISFIRKWDNRSTHSFNVDKRFILLRGSSGFYSYIILERLPGFPELKVELLRMVFRLQENRYMIISDRRQRIMPTNEERSRGTVLDYVEAVLLTNSSDPALKGEVDDKYQYSSENKDAPVHGWISDDTATGFWMISPSNEYRVGGPLKQELTSHCGPTTLSVFFSPHYVGRKKALHFAEGEPWKKVFGPIFVYLNSGSKTKQTRQALWQDAKDQMLKETVKWPYSFPLSKDYLKLDQRGSLSGQIQVFDRYISKDPRQASLAYVGLAPPGDLGSWQLEYKGYQFWTRTDTQGGFIMKGIRAGTYNLFAWVPGYIGDYKYNESIIITPGSKIILSTLVFKPPRNGPTLWEIGTPDRTAAEFYVPDPIPTLMNRLYVNFDKFRQYGLWTRYTELYPDKDLIYTVGLSNYSRDWFYAQFSRSIGNQEFSVTTWQIVFQLNNVEYTNDYTLRLALASATNTGLEVRVNNDKMGPPNLRTGKIGEDNAIARHGIHAVYNIFEVKIPGNQLMNGENTIYLKQTMRANLLSGIIYDYIRLEGP